MTYEDVRAKYEQISSELYSNKQKFADYLGFSGRFYKLPTEQAMAVFAVNPNAKTVADYDTWKKFGRQVKRNEPSIPYISNGQVKHCFEISQTVGEKEPFQWRLDKQTVDTFKEKYTEEHDGVFASMAHCIGYAAVEEVNANVGNIIGNLQISSKNSAAFQKSVRSMVRQVIKSRCEYQSSIKLNVAPLDLSAVDMLHSKAEFDKLCEWVQITAKSALKKIEKSINEIIFERSIDNGRSKTAVVRGGSEILSDNSREERDNVRTRPENVDVQRNGDDKLHGGGTGTAEKSDTAIRQSVAEVYGGELPVYDSTASNAGEIRNNSSSSGQGSRGDGLESFTEVFGNPSAPDNVLGNGAMGENEAVGNRQHSNDGSSSESERVISERDTYITKTAEGNSSAVSFSEKSFAEQVDDSLAGKLPFYTNLKVCDTPQILLDIGCEQLPMLYTQKHLRNAIKPDSSKEHFHGLDVELIKRLPELLDHPVMIYDSLSRKDSIIILTSEYDKNNNPVIASIKPNGEGKYELETIQSNFITSVHGRENFISQIKRAKEQDKILFCDKKKSQEMFERWGLQLSELTNTLDFNTIIHQSRNIVNPISEKNPEISDLNENTESTQYSIFDINPQSVSSDELHEEIQQEYPVIYVNGSFNRNFNVADVGFEVNKPYTVEEFNAALKKANELYVADDRFEDKLYEVNVSVFASEDRSATYNFEIYAEYHSIGEIMDTKQSIADTQTLSELASAISEIERKAQKTEIEDHSEPKAEEAKSEAQEKSATYSTIPAEQEKHNFRITAETEIGLGGLKTKFQNNIAAIETLKKIEQENRLATPDEQQILAKYVGWGGIPQAFDSENSSWAKEYSQLKELLTDIEYEAARGSVLNAHYTNPTVINAMYKALDNMGFKRGNVLEPSMGVGNFFGCMPEKMTDSKLYGVELDSITGRIAKQLYPKADIRVQGYENADFPDNFFDVAIGNVPFGNYSIADKRYDKEHFLIHDYFFAKTLDKVSPGGVVAFITSKGTLDKENPKVREYLAKRADLIGAIRLPNNAFNNAGTEVTSDIIFLQKREKMAVELPDWCYTAKNADGITENQYFIDHPEMVLGKMELVSGRYGEETACVPIEGAELSEQLEKAVATLKANITTRKIANEKQKERGELPATSDVRNFTHTIVDGKLYFRENNVMREVAETGTALERMKALHELRNSMRSLITAQENNCSDEELQQLQSGLNNRYDDFVKKFGNVSSRTNSNVFSDDDDYNILCSLENYDAETKTYTKADIFSKRTVKAKTEITEVDTPQDALQVSLDMKGRVDVLYMSQLCGETPENTAKTLVNAGIIFKNPEAIKDDNSFYGYEEASEYLSGNIREKLRAAQKAAEDNPEYSRNLTALENVLPEKINASEIHARIGVNWVDIEDYKRFMIEYAHADYFSIKSLHRTVTGEYKIDNKRRDKSIAATSSYGTMRMTSIEIFERLLNNRDIIIKDRHEDVAGGVYYTVNTKETQLAQNKALAMKEAFERWLWDNPERREKYETRYNELFNSLVGREYDGSHQTFPGMNPYIKLNPHQLNAVQRAKLGGNTLLAHCVGAGKSFEMIAATMEKKRLGLINKACVVVPKPLIRQMANEWLRLYPDAKILVAGEKDFTENNRQKFIGRCCTGDYAAVIMSQQQFEKIPMSLEYRMNFMRDELDLINQGIAEGNSTGSRGTVKELERVKKSLEAKISKLLNAKTKDEALTFEQLGFDSLVVDEAHGYKNGMVVTKMSNVAGVQTTAAQKSEDILMKTKYLNEQSGCKNIIFATGTPISNSMVEMYTMQRYLRPDLLESAGLENFDDWASTFGEVVTQLEQSPDGQSFRPKKRFAKFSNLPELMLMYKEFADIRTPDMIKLPIPEIKDGKAQTIVAKPSEFQEAYVQQLAERSDKIHSGAVDPKDDNMLKITHEARLLGLDARCINPDAENDPTSKVNLCIDKIMEIYNRTNDTKGVQAVFCDIAINDTDGEGKPAFSVYKYIREELERRGIPADEICAAGDAKNDAQRTEMMSQLNSGKKRIIIASTSKMGTGANFQHKLCALHHLDIPWKPSDLEQRNGRILRQGNENKEVEIYHYLTEKTFDSYMMSIIVNKQKFISQIMSGKTPARTCQDVDEMVLNYSEMQAIASGDPRIKEKIELDGDVARLRMLESEYKKGKYEMQNNVIKYDTSVKRLTEIAIPKCQSDIDYAKENTLPEDSFSIRINGVNYTERKEAGNIIRKKMIEVMKDLQSREIGEYRGFKLSLSKGIEPTPTITLHRENGLIYYGDTSLDTDIGNVIRIENMVNGGLDKKLKKLNEELEFAKENLAEARRNLERPFEHADELAEKSARLEQLNRELNIDKADEVIVDNEENIGEQTEQRKIKAPAH